MTGKWLRFLLVIFALALRLTCAVRVTGRWNTGTDRVKVVTKFGFQQTSALDRKNTRGFVFGNVTSASSSSSRSFLFALVPQTLIGSFYNGFRYTSTCDAIMHNISQIGFESRCLTKGKRGDIFRWIPCVKGKLCREEDDPKVVIPGYQMTMQIEEPSTPEYWYVVLVACNLDTACKWVQSNTSAVLDYDIWLTNGRPGSRAASSLTLQFSFDEQDTLEIYVVTFVTYLVLFWIMSHGLQLIKGRAPPERLRLLNVIIVMKTTGIALQCLNVYVFSLDGQGLFFARVLGEILRVAGIEVLWLLLLLLSRGWELYPKTAVSLRSCFIAWSIFAAVYFLLFIFNFIYLFDVLHEIDVFSSWPGYGQLFVRIVLALWFLAEIRKLILREKNEERAAFVAHIGAGFLVWFVYLPGLGVIAMFISQLWRFKIILGITTFANYVIIGCLLHLFWPTSSYRKYFYLESHLHRHRTESLEIHDLEKLLFDTEESDFDTTETNPDNPLLAI